jgi:hypothetical protein
MATYPTKKEIMEKEQKFKPEVIKIVKNWQKVCWKIITPRTPENKFHALSILINDLSELYNKPVCVEYRPSLHSCCYVPNIKTVYINDSASIISLLHEFAHHVFGHSETKACKWSVWLFKKTFPLSFNKLKWKGHMLVK